MTAPRSPKPKPVQVTRITIRGIPPERTWKVTAAILEAIQPGASGHALKRYARKGYEAWEHVRLGVTVAVETFEDGEPA